MTEDHVCCSILLTNKRGINLEKTQSEWRRSWKIEDWVWYKDSIEKNSGSFEIYHSCCYHLTLKKEKVFFVVVFHKKFPLYIYTVEVVWESSSKFALPVRNKSVKTSEEYPHIIPKYRSKFHVFLYSLMLILSRKMVEFFVLTLQSF